MYKHIIGIFFLFLSARRNSRWRPFWIFYEICTLSLLEIRIKPAKINNFSVDLDIQMDKEFIGIIFEYVSVQRNPRWMPFWIFYGIRTLNLL